MSLLNFVANQVNQSEVALPLGAGHLIDAEIANSFQRVRAMRIWSEPGPLLSQL